MSENLGKIATKKIPASQAIPGNPEHARLMAAQGYAANGSRHKWHARMRRGFWLAAVLLGLVVSGFLVANFAI